MGPHKLLTAPEESFPALPNLSIWQKIEYVPCPNRLNKPPTPLVDIILLRTAIYPPDLCPR